MSRPGDQGPDPFRTPLRSMAEVHALERAAALGAPVLGEVVRALCDRWAAGLRDEDCLLHLVVAEHLGRVRPTWHAGPLPEPQPIPAMVEELGGVETLTAETCFALAWIAHFDDAVFGDCTDDALTAKSLAARAARLAPRSRLFAMWRFFLGERDEAEQVHRLRRVLLHEIHARFSGRGALGTLIDPPLRKAVRTALRSPRL